MRKRTVLSTTVVCDEGYRLLHPKRGEHYIDVLDTMDRSEMRSALIDIQSFVYFLRKAHKALGLVAKVRPSTQRERERRWIRDAEERAVRAEYDAELLASARARQKRAARRAA